MSTHSQSPWVTHSRGTGSVGDGQRRVRAPSRAARQTAVTFDDAYSFALRVAFLHYLLQPKKRRKEYVPAPKPLPRAHTSAINDLMKEFMPSGSATPSSRLPHAFRPQLEKRIEGILQGSERLPGFSDADVKRTFAEAYMQFTRESFRKSIDIDRKIEPLVLIFYASATKAQSRGKAPDDHSWKGLPDRHTALLVRLISGILRDHGSDRDKPDLMKSLDTLENKLLTNDQNLSLGTAQDGGLTIEIEVPLSYEIKDMPMVQIVTKIFGVTNSRAQTDIDGYRPLWTEEAALKDLKQYQHRLNSNMAGALRRQDFDIDEAYEDWKKNEAPHLSQMMLDILTARPELAKTSSGGYEKPLPVRPVSTYGEEQAYSDLSKMISSPDSTASFGFDPSVSLGSLSLDDSASSIRAVDEPSFTFIPPDPRAFYKSILQYAVSFDQLHGEPELPDKPLSKQSTDLLVELSVWWRIPQFTRHVVFLEVAARKFLDQEMNVRDLNAAFDFVKDAVPETKKPPHIQLFTSSLPEIETSRWTMKDFAIYQQTLGSLNDALLRELYSLLQHCYEPKPSSISPVMYVIETHVYGDGAFTPREEDIADFSRSLEDGLRKKAAQVYRGYLDDQIPRSQEDWDFGHVVGLGKAVVGLCERIKKRYRKNPEIMGVNPFTILVETMFPSFEADAHDLIQRILQVAKDRGVEVNLQDGFDMYKELVEIRKIHVECLPGKPFAFHVEGLLEDFVWRWIRTADTKMEEFVDSAIQQDVFQVRASSPDHVPTDAERHSVSILDLFHLFNQTLDQVFELNWDDDVHHARFMTGLAKAFTAGIGRYCDIVEQRFAKEMDRPTAEEVAAAGKSTQERFLQYAKDAWNNKEKVEPFQFYPESFVKLNNIEYAMQALDKLEKRMNVDQCYEVLRRVDGPKEQQSRKAAKNVFTIKIVEAEDLKACDPTGTSDPYVVLCDEFQKRLAKTRIIMRNLNPRWDESVDITVQGPLNIIATIWDYDTFGDHDFVGRTSLKLDPLHFSDYLPREYWLDLDTQGRLLLRVSMEGERDDIQFYFGKSFRHLKRTERDMVRKITDKLRAHINASLSRDALRILLSRGGLAASMASMWKKRASTAPSLTSADVENALQALFTYFNENFAIMKETLTDATMVAVMTRLWKEVLMAIESLVVPPLSEKPSLQKPLTQTELDVVYRWLQLLFDFFNARDEEGEVLGVPADVLKTSKWHELASLNFFYFDTTENLVRTSERMAAATAQRAQQQLQTASTGPSPFHSNRLSAPAALGPMAFSGSGGVGGGFASLGTIRRGKSIMMSRNLGTMRRAKEERRKEAQADPSDDMILRILRMRPEAAGYLKERHRQRERMAASNAAALILRQSLSSGWAPAPVPGGGGGGGGSGAGAGAFGRNNLPRR